MDYTAPTAVKVRSSEVDRWSSYNPRDPEQQDMFGHKIYAPKPIQTAMDLGSSFDDRVQTMGNFFYNNKQYMSLLGVKNLLVQGKTGGNSGVRPQTFGNQQVTTTPDLLIQLPSGEWICPDNKYTREEHQNYQAQLFIQGRSARDIIKEKGGEWHDGQSVRVMTADAYRGSLNDNIALQAVDRMFADLDREAGAWAQRLGTTVEAVRNNPEFMTLTAQRYAQALSQYVMTPVLHHLATHPDPVKSPTTTPAPHSKEWVTEYPTDAATEQQVTQAVLRTQAMKQAILDVTGHSYEELFADEIHDRSRMIPGEYEARKAWQSQLFATAYNLAKARQEGHTPSLTQAQHKLNWLLVTAAGVKVDLIPGRNRPVVDRNAPAQINPSTRLGVINNSFRQIGQTPAWTNGQVVLFDSGAKTASGDKIAAAVGTYRRDPTRGDIILINERVVVGGEEGLRKLGSKVAAAFVQHKGSWAGEKQANISLTDELRNNPYFPSSGTTRAMEAKIGSQVEVRTIDPKTGLPMDESAQQIQAHIMAGNTPIFFKNNNRYGIQAIPWLRSTPGMYVEGEGHQAQAYVGGREGKIFKDLQKAARDYQLSFAGRQFVSPIRMAGASAPESMTSYTAMQSNLTSYGQFRSDVAGGMVGSTLFRRRIPLAADTNVTLDNPRFEGGQLILGTQSDGEIFKHAERNWDNITEVQASIRGSGNRRYVEITGIGHIDMTKRSAKSWEPKFMSVEGDGYDLENYGAEAITPRAANPRLFAYGIVSAHFREKGGQGVRDGLLDVVGRRADAREHLATQFNTTPDQVLDILKKELGNSGAEEFVWGTSKKLDSAMYWLARDLEEKGTGVRRVEVGMTRHAYERWQLLRGTYGKDDVSGKDRGVVDVPASAWGDNPDKMVKVGIYDESYLGKAASQFTNPHAIGHGRASFEEILSMLKNPHGYSDSYVQAITKDVLPKIMSRGARDRVTSEWSLKAYLLSTGAVSPAEILGANWQDKIVDFEDAQKTLIGVVDQKGVTMHGGFYRTLRDMGEKWDQVKVSDGSVDTIYNQMTPGVLDQSALRGKLVRVGNTYLVPLDVMGNMLAWSTGERPTYGNSDDEWSENHGKRKQLNEYAARTRALFEGDPSGADFDKNVADLRGSFLKQATGRTTIQNALSSKGGLERTYVLDDNIPGNMMLLGQAERLALFGTEDITEINAAIKAGGTPVGLILRRPSQDTTLVGDAPLSVGMAEDYGYGKGSGLVFGRMVADFVAGDDDGDRVMTWMTTTLKGLVDPKRKGHYDALREAASPEAQLARLSRGWSVLMGEQHEFGSQAEYMQFVYDVYKTGKLSGAHKDFSVNQTELGKRMAEMAEQGKLQVGSPETWEQAGDVAVLEGNVYKGESLSKAGMGFAYNRFKRNLGTLRDMFGVGDSESGERARQYIYQVALDKQLFSGGLRTAMAIGNSYMLAGQEIRDGLAPDVAGTLASGKMPFAGSVAPESLGFNLIKSALTAHELRGGGYNAQWIEDVAKALTGSEGGQAALADAIRTSPELKDILARYGESDYKGRLDMEKEMQETLEKQAVSLARRLYSDHFGGDIGIMLREKGWLTAMTMGQVINRAASKNGGREYAQFTALQGSLPVTSDEYARMGRKVKSFQQVASGKAGEDTGFAMSDLAGALHIPMDNVADLIDLFDSKRYHARPSNANAIHNLHWVDDKEVELIETVKAQGFDFDGLIGRLKSSDMTVGQVLQNISNKVLRQGASIPLKSDGSAFPDFGKDVARNKFSDAFADASTPMAVGIRNMMKEAINIAFGADLTQDRELAFDVQKFGKGILAALGNADFSAVGNLLNGARGQFNQDNPIPDQSGFNAPNHTKGPAGGRAGAGGGGGGGRSGGGGGGYGGPGWWQDRNTGTWHYDINRQYGTAAMRPGWSESIVSGQLTPSDILAGIARNATEKNQDGYNIPVHSPAAFMLANKILGGKVNGMAGDLRTIGVNGGSNLSTGESLATEMLNAAKLQSGRKAVGTHGLDILTDAMAGGQFTDAEFTDLLQQGASSGTVSNALKRVQSGKFSFSNMVSFDKFAKENGLSPEIAGKLFDLSNRQASLNEASREVEKFGGSIRTAARHTEGYNETIKDIQASLESGKKLEGKALVRAQTNTSEMRGLSELMGETPEGWRQFATLARSSGLSGKETRLLVKALKKFQQVSESETDALSLTGDSSMKGSAGLRQQVGKLFEGDLGQLGWGMMNVSRIWNMTGGQVQGHMQDYAKYAAGQQQSMMDMGGTMGYTGPVADVISQQNAVRKFGLSAGKAGWDMFGGVTRLIGGSGDSINVDQPSGATYLGVGGAVAGGGMIGLALAKNLAGRLLGKEFGAALAENIGASLFNPAGLASEAAGGAAQTGAARVGGIAGNIGSRLSNVSLLPALASVAGGMAVGSAISYDLNRRGGLLEDKAVADLSMGDYMKTRAADIGGLMMASGGPGIGGGIATIFNAVTGGRFMSEEDKARGAAWAAAGKEGAGLATEMSASQLQYNTYSNWGKALEDRNKTLAAGEGLTIGSTIAQVTGISDGQLTSDSAVAWLADLMAQQGMSDVTKERAQIGTAMGRMTGLKSGDTRLANYAGNAMNMSPAELMKAQSMLQRMAPVQQYMSETGNTAEGLFGSSIPGMEGLAKSIPLVGSILKALKIPMTGGGATELGAFSQTQIGRAYGGDQRALSQLGLAMSGGAPMQDWMSLIAPNVNRANLENSMMLDAGGQNIGYRWGSGRLLKSYSDVGTIAPFLSRMPAGTLSGSGDTSSFNLNGQAYDYSQVGLQLASFDENQRNQQFNLAQSRRKFDTGFSYTTGQPGLSGTGAGANFTLGGPVSITIAGKTQQVTDAVSGQAITGRGQWQMDDWSRTISRMQQQIGFNFQQEGLTLSDSQFHENMGLRRQQFEYDTQYQRQGLDIQRERIGLQYNRGIEDLSFQGAQTSLGYAWGGEDTAEALRYATGRERRSLLKKRERETVQYAMSMGRLDTQEGRLGEDKDLALRDLDRGREYFEKHIEWTREEMAMSLRQHEQNQDLNQRQLDANRDGAREINRLQDESTAKQRQYYMTQAAEEQLGLDRQALTMANQVKLTLGEIALSGMQLQRQADAAGILAKGGVFDQINKATDAAGQRIKTMLDGLAGGQQTLPYQETWTPGHEVKD